jgi:rubrerythrin
VINKQHKTYANLRTALTFAALGNRLYLYMAAKADVQGNPELSAIFRSTAEGLTGHAHGSLEYLERLGDPLTEQPYGETAVNLNIAIAAGDSAADMLGKLAADAKEEGFEEIADWFETLARANKAHASRYREARTKAFPKAD